MTTVIRALIPCQFPNVLIAVETTLGHRLDVVERHGFVGLVKVPTIASRLVGLVFLR